MPTPFDQPPDFSQTQMPVAPPRPTAPPMPQAPAFGQQPPVNVRPSGMQIAALIPALLAGIKDPRVAGAAVAGLHRGQDAKQARMESQQQQTERRQMEQAQLYATVSQEAASHLDAISHQQYLDAVAPILHQRGLDPSMFPYSDSKRQAADKKLVSDAMDRAEKHTPGISDRDDVSLHLADGRKVSMQTARALVGGGVTDATGASVPAAISHQGDFTLNPGDTRFGADGTQIATGGAKAEPQGSIELQYAAAEKRGDTAEMARLKRAANIRDNPRTGTGGPTDYQQFTMSEKLASAWTKANAPVREMERQLRIMDTGLKRYRAGDTNGGSQAVLVTFQKILDPTSVVRESEYARTSAGQSFIARIEGYMDRLSKGGAGLTDAEMAKMVATAQEMVSDMNTWRAGTRSRIEAQTKEYGIKPATVFDDVLTGGASAPATGVTIKSIKEIK